MMVLVTIGATGCGPSNRSNLLVSAIICCDCEFWDIQLSIWDTSLDISVAGTWFFLDVGDCALPILADVRVDTRTFVALLPSIQRYLCRVLDFSSRGHGGAMANLAKLRRRCCEHRCSCQGHDLNGICILGGEYRVHGPCDTDFGSLWIFMGLRRTCIGHFALQPLDGHGHVDVAWLWRLSPCL